MIKKIAAATIIIILAMNYTACAKPEKKRHEAEFLMLFDTVTQIVGYTESKEQFNVQAQLIHDNLKEYHQLFDIYHEYEGMNNIKTINDQAVDSKVDGNVYFTTDSAKSTFEMDADSSITGKQEVKKQ